MRAAGANPYRSHEVNQVLGGPPPGQFANLPAVEGGAAPYGMLVGPNQSLVAPAIASFAGNNAPPPQPGHLRVGAVARVNASFLNNQFGMGAFANNNQDVMIFSAFGNLKNPAMMSVDTQHNPIFDYIPSAPVRLRAGMGYLNDPSLTPGAIAPTDLATLNGSQNFIMYTSGTQRVTAAFAPYGEARQFSGTPQVGVLGSPGAGAVFLEDRGLAFLGIDVTSRAFGSSRGFSQEAEAAGDYGPEGRNTSTTINLRAGQTTTFSSSVEGTGNAGTLVSGDLRLRSLKPQLSLFESGPMFTQVAQSFNQIAVGQQWNSLEAQIVSAGLQIGTTQRVAEAIFTPDYDETIRNIIYPVAARIFGPSPTLIGEGTNGNTFTLPTIDLGASGVATFNLQNADVLSSIDNFWRNAIRGTPDLIRLTVLGFDVIDPANVFTVDGLGSTPFALDGNASRAINIGFNPTEVGTYQATLRLRTDMNAEVGQLGDYYSITLSATATAVPEPTSFVILGTACGLLMRLARRKRNQSIKNRESVPV